MHARSLLIQFPAETNSNPQISRLLRLQVFYSRVLGITVDKHPTASLGYLFSELSHLQDKDLFSLSLFGIFFAANHDHCLLLCASGNSLFHVLFLEWKTAVR